MKQRIQRTSWALSALAGFIAMAAPVAFAASASMEAPSIKHQPKDGVVKLYGAGGPHTAFKKVADVFQKETSIKVEIISGPEHTWTKNAQADADILWGTSQQSMTAFLETYKAFSSDQVMPIYIRRAIIAIKKGNPKNITGFDDLLKDGMRIVVTEGAGVYNTSGTGVWEDVAGRSGKLGDIQKFRKNIVAFAKGSGASFKAFMEKDADAWITWPNWPITNADKLELVEIEAPRQIWRDINIAISTDADPEAKKFAEFLLSDRGAEIMKTEGWVR